MENQTLTKEQQGELLYKYGLEKYKLGKNKIKGEAKKYIRAAIKDFEEAIALCNGNAMVKMGDIHFYGLPESINYNLSGEKMIDEKKAIELYNKAAALNNSKALVKLGDLYYNRYKSFVKKDYNVAKKYYEQADLLNNNKASYYLGLIYNDGISVTRDKCRAFKYFERADSFGNNKASYFLGEEYRNGFFVKQDYNRAFKYYEKASLLNNSQALNRLGWLYDRGFGVKQDHVKAMEYFNSAVKTKKNSDALNSIGCIYYRKNDLENAKEYFEKAMSNHGQNNLDVLEYKQDYPLVISPRNIYPNSYGHRPRDDRDFEDEDGREEEEYVNSANKELERIYQNAKEYFYKAACRGHSDAIADNDVLLYVIERVNSDYCRNGFTPLKI
jgi:TPR repeat protein